MISNETFAAVATEMHRISADLEDLQPGLSLTGEIFLDLAAKRVWFRVWNEEPNTTHWVAWVPEKAAPGENLVAVDDTSEALMFS
ncbi:hypothetical protein DRROBERT_49 [Arthrobacter phage DrRobert]|uniref:Uncharacterized protein n=2 Tax=Korravirus TaxID=1982076 RepID=A0A0U4K6Z4_9CAUD|nr:hypothetical protein FDH55_gp50 [Arthrobacter phage Bennie]YP_009602546.1 hypothetical protein FDH56_gp49 [Arthrobacter phage DrRobert]ALY08587.1 hypothetical protein BENNIE_51 [Arthrobacter phage Bennie]ALY08835.1 hypothetical protein DRROBERT_49 [Arthrobacter phage DrRobert]